MPNYFWNALLILSLAACQQHGAVENATLPNSDAIELDTFSRIPIAFANCGGAFATSDFSLGERRFVFVHGETEALAVIEGREVRLSLEGERKTDGVLQKTFSGDGYRAVLSLQPSNRSDAATGLWEGDLELKNRTASVRYNVVGHCGCR